MTAPTSQERIRELLDSADADTRKTIGDVVKIEREQLYRVVPQRVKETIVAAIKDAVK
jgi:hypothetical protein